MASRLHALSIDALDPVALAAFWGGVLGQQPEETAGVPTLAPVPGTGFRLRFLASADAKDGQNRAHLDLTSQSLQEQQDTVARVLALGGDHCDIGQGPEVDHVVMADPEGNELCVIPPGNSFLAGCGLVGALSCDGSRAVGHFWSAALGWPLVWDQDEETAIQSPDGGSKISWGGPPLMPRPGARDRFHLDLVADGDVEAEVRRLVGHGATVLGDGLMADPDGNQLYVD